MRFRVVRGVRHLLIIIVAALLLPIAIGIALRGYSAWQARTDIYTLQSVPDRPVAIIFGALIYGNHSLSGMLADRVEAGAELYHAGKVKALLLTGDNHIDGYNEPETTARRLLHDLHQDGAKLTRTVKGDPKTHNADELWCVQTDQMVVGGNLPLLFVIWRIGSTYQGDHPLARQINHLPALQPL